MSRQPRQPRAPAGQVPGTAPVNQGETGLTNGYNDQQFLALNRHLMASAVDNRSAGHFLRTRLDLTMGHFFVLRGENRRIAELADFYIHTLPAEEGVTDDYCLIFVINNGKTNKWGKTQYMGALRHTNVELCPIGAFAQYLFWRWNGGGETFPDFSSQRAWYPRKLLVGNTAAPTKQLSYATQLHHVSQGFDAIGIDSNAKTQTMRGSSVRGAGLHGIGEAQLAEAGRWSMTSAMVGDYLTSLPMKFVREMAGFPTTSGNYYLPRALMQPPPELTQQIWPECEEWLERDRIFRTQKKTFAQGGLDQKDLAMLNFINMLVKLRAVLCQDLAILEQNYPRLPMLAQPVFQSLEWRAFAESMRD